MQVNIYRYVGKLSRAMPPNDVDSKLVPVGARVRFSSARRQIMGTVVEDLGLIGVGGRQLVRVEAPLGSSYVSQFDIPAESLTQVYNSGSRYRIRSGYKRLDKRK
jgi:hypothetical protein